jgi:hypothetical protein
LVAGAALASLASQVLGEYEFEGWLPFFAGPVVGLLVAEMVVTIGRWRDPAVAVFCAAATALSLVWAGRIDAGAGVEDVKPLVWVAAVLGAVTAYLRVQPAVLTERFRR